MPARLADYSLAGSGFSSGSDSGSDFRLGSGPGSGSGSGSLLGCFGLSWLSGKVAAGPSYRLAG